MRKNIFLLPFALIYRIIVGIRNLLFDLKILPTKELDFPVIAIGNITVGGTGKTPHIEMFIELLKEKYKVAVLSRGYKRKTRGFVLATSESKVQDIGDEPRQIKSKFPDIEVAVDAKRIRGAQMLIEKTESQIVLLDDAFQHRYIKPVLSILLIDFNRPISEDYLLPYGELRESIRGKQRANIIIVTKAPQNIKPIERRILSKQIGVFPYQELFFSTMKYGEIKPVFSINKNRINDQIIINNKFSILLVTCIAQPAPLLDHLKTITQDVTSIAFADHHYFTKKDIQLIERKFEEIENPNKIILTTHKDAVRLIDCFLSSNLSNIFVQNIFYISLKVEILHDSFDEFEKIIFKYIEKDKYNAILKKNRKKTGIFHLLVYTLCAFVNFLCVPLWL